MLPFPHQSLCRRVGVRIRHRNINLCSTLHGAAIGGLARNLLPIMVAEPVPRERQICYRQAVSQNTAGQTQDARSTYRAHALRNFTVLQARC